MKTIRVVAAIIEKTDEKGQTVIFATQRGYGEMKGGWEFPGGKIEAGETPEQALIREIQEEFGVSLTEAEKIIEVYNNKINKTCHQES